MIKTKKEFGLYFIIGICTTLVDLVVYGVCTNIISGKALVMGISWHLIAQAISWIASVLFAYPMNKHFVFRSTDRNIGIVAKEFLSFAGGRFISLALQTALMWLFIDMWAMDMWGIVVWGSGLIGQEGHFGIKCLVCAIVMVVNYLFSKFVVFRKNQSKTGEV